MDGAVRRLLSTPAETHEEMVKRRRRETTRKRAKKNLNVRTELIG
jgi:hypothetical protein